MELPIRGLVKRGVRLYRTDGLVAVLTHTPRFLVVRAFDEPTWFYWRTKLRHQWQQVRYVTPAHPWKCIRIDPDSLNTANYELSKNFGLGLIRSGEWDAPENNVPLDTYWSVRGIRERFVDGLDWEDTCYYQKARTRLQEAGEFWGYEDLETFKRERCRYVDALYADIERRGYRANADDEHTVPETTFKQKPHQHLEVLVTIGRSGELLFYDGHHRIAIAQLLDVEEIPMQVLARHRDWQRTRDAVSMATSPTDLSDDVKAKLSHPDLQDVILESRHDALPDNP